MASVAEAEGSLGAAKSAADESVAVVVEEIIVVAPEGVLASDSVQEFRERIAAVKGQFAVAATEALGQAETIVTDAVAALNQALLSGVADLGQWRESDQGDTAQLHAAMHRYGEYLDRVLSI
jgi:hypothetical protein